MLRKHLCPLNKKTLKLPRNIVEGDIAIILGMDKVVFEVPSE